MKTILFIHHGKGYGGASTSLRSLISDLPNEKYLIKVLFIFNSDVVESFKDLNIDCKVLNSYFYSKYYKYWPHTVAFNIKIYHFRRIFWTISSWFMSAFWFSKKIILKENPDIVYLNSSVLTDWALASKILGIRCIMHIREPIANGLIGFRKALIRHLLKFSCSDVIFISRDNAARMKRLQNKHVVYNYVREPKIHLNASNKHTNTNMSMFLYVGGSSLLKGFEILVKSLKYLDENIVILFAGYYIDCKKKSIIKNVKNRRIIKNQAIMNSSYNAINIGRFDDIFTHLQKCKAIIFPAIEPHFARPVIEAYADRKIAICSNVEGAREIVKDELTGFIFSNRNYRDLAKKINFVSSLSSSEYDAMTEAAFKYYREEFTPNNIRKIEKIIDK